MRRPLLFAVSSAVLALAFGTGVRTEPTFNLDKNFDDLTQAEKTTAKRAAKIQQIRPLTACADPGNMPLSNDESEGYQNRIIELLAEKMSTSVSFFWRPYYERGLTRETFDYNQCDLLLGMPAGYSGILETLPLYRSTYVFAYREDSGIHIEDLDDPDLKKLSIGVFQHSGIRQALARRGIKDNIRIHYISYNADLVPENQPWQQVQSVVEGRLDIAAAWGPFAGYVKTKKNAPLTIQPVNLMEDRTQLEFSLTIGMRRDDVVLKYALDRALKDSKEEITEILEAYGVPLVECSECMVQGDLPSHGSYSKDLIAEDPQDRFLKPYDANLAALDPEQASEDQVVDRKRLEKWLDQGADLNAELTNAVVASDPERVRFLVGKGADPDAENAQGEAGLHIAARNRDSEMIDLLLDLGADPNLRDKGGWTPLLHAAYRNHVPSVKRLIEGGADTELRSPDGLTPLGIACGERKFFAARALIEAGADVNAVSTDRGMTPLMLVATHHKSGARQAYLESGLEPSGLARMLIDNGADVNAATSKGVTALMIAAGFDNSPLIGLLIQNGADPHATSDAGKTALMVAREAGSDAAEKSLSLFESVAPDGGGAP